MPPVTVTVMARCAARRGAAAGCCASRLRTVRRRSCRLQGNGNASERTHAGSDRVHGVEAVASAPLQPGLARRVDIDALRNLPRDGGEPDAAAAARRCSAARPRSAGSAARRPCRRRGAVALRSHRRSTGCHGRTGSRRRPRPCNRRRRTRGGCPRWREIAIEDWTATRVSGDTLRSRRNGASRSRVLKEARHGYHTCSPGFRPVRARWSRHLVAIAPAIGIRYVRWPAPSPPSPGTRAKSCAAGAGIRTSSDRRIQAGLGRRRHLVDPRR